MSTDRLTEVLNYLSAMSRDVGALRTEVRANGVAIQELRTETKARFDALETEMRAGFEQVRSDIRRLKHQMEVVTEDSMEFAG